MAENSNNTYRGIGQGLDAMSSIAFGFMQGSALRAQGEYESRMLMLNAKFADFFSEDALKRGDKAAAAYQQQVAQLKGQQRVALAASGVQLGEGSAAEIDADTSLRAAENVSMIRSNAWREAWGFKVQAQDYRGQAAYRKLAGDFNADMAIAGGLIEGFRKGFQASTGTSSRNSNSTPGGQRVSLLNSGGSSLSSLLSNSGRGPGQWGTMQDGSHGYGYAARREDPNEYRSMWG